MKKVVVYGLKNIVGGLETYLLNMQTLLKNDVQFCYLFENQNGCIHEEVIKKNGGTIVPILPRHPLKAHIKSIKEVLKEYRKETDTIYFNNNDISFDFIVVKIARRLKYRIVFYSPNAMMEPISNKLSFIIHKTFELYGRLVVRTTRRLIRTALSSRASKYMFGKKDFILVPSGINSEKFCFNKESRAKIRKELNVSESTKLFGFIGRLVNVKNPLFAIKTFNEYNKTINEDSKLVIVGDGALKETCINLIKDLGIADKVILIEPIDNIFEYYSAFDMLIACSLSEGLGNVVIEAQASGLPVVCALRNYPPDVKVTDLVKFNPLKKDNYDVWSKAMDAQFNCIKKHVDRADYCTDVKDSNLDIRNCAATLKRVLLG